MGSCNGCGDRMPSGQSGSLCALCIAKMVNYAHGDYDDENDPAVKLFKSKRDEREQPSAQSGCAVVVLAAAAVPAALAAVGMVVARLVG